MEDEGRIERKKYKGNGKSIIRKKSGRGRRGQGKISG